MLKKMVTKKKIQIRIIADADTEEFALDIEEIHSLI